MKVDDYSEISLTSFECLGHEPGKSILADGLDIRIWNQIGRKNLLTEARDAHLSSNSRSRMGPEQRAVRQPDHG